jgi:formylglycine-generating enzyme required for sulfatase activity
METKTYLDPLSGVDFLQVPAGRFRMGTPEEDDTVPVRPVTVSGFWLGRTPVTREHYARFMEATKRPEPGHWKHELFLRPGSPVVGVTWEDAAAFAVWCGARLPTEAEWEYAARGSDGRRYPWGNESPSASRAIHHRDIGFDGTSPVGGALAGAGPFGHLDLAGNVFEWCADWYAPDYYAHAPAENPNGPATGKLRVIRGGSWVSMPDACRSACREKFPPGKSSVLIGFRVARSLVPG